MAWGCSHNVLLSFRNPTADPAANNIAVSKPVIVAVICGILISLAGLAVGIVLLARPSQTSLTIAVQRVNNYCLMLI